MTSDGSYRYLWHVLGRRMMHVLGKRVLHASGRPVLHASGKPASHVLSSLAGACLVACVVMAAGCSRDHAGAAGDGESTVSVEVRVAHVELRTLAERVAAPGQWRAANELLVTAPFAALVESLSVRPGDRVRQGQTVGVLATRESRAAIRGAELMLRQAGDDAARAEAQRALDMARHDLVRVPLVAAASGVVVRRSAEPGAEVAEGSELLKLVSEHDLVFEAHIPLTAARLITPGRIATIVMAGGNDVRAVVQRRLPNTSADDQSALVWLSPVSAVPPDVLDRFGVATIETGAPRRVVAVPDSALVADDLTGDVLVARVGAGDIAVWTPLRVGLAADGWHELTSGHLKPGDALVIRGQRGLPDSTHVHIVP